MRPAGLAVNQNAMVLDAIQNLHTCDDPKCFHSLGALLPVCRAAVWRFACPRNSQDRSAICSRCSIRTVCMVLGW